MSDALSLLRNFVKIKKDFHEEDDKIIFGDVYYPKNVKTTYLIYGTGKDGKPKDYYTLECLAFLIKHRDLQHPMYVKSAGLRNISVVSRPDRRDLLSYLDGEVDTAQSIDKNAPLEIAMQRPQPYIKTSSAIAQNLASSSSSSAHPTKRPATVSLENEQNTDLDLSGSKLSKLNESSDQNDPSNLNQASLIGLITKKFDQTAAQSQRPITENITDLSEQLTKEKIVAIKAKKKAQQRKQVASGDVDDDLLNKTSQSSQPTIKASATSREDRKITTELGSSFIAGITGVGDENDAIVKEIFKREAVCKNRFTVLQSSGKQFEKDINAFLQLIKAKEEGNNETGLNNTQTNGSSQQMQQSQQNMSQKSRPLGYNRFDQERYPAKDETGGFSIDTKLTYQPSYGALSLTPNPNATPNNSNMDSQRSILPQSSYYQSSQLTQQNKNIINSSMNPSSQSLNRSNYKSPTSSSQSQKRTSTRPIIIIPNTSTSLITMFNCLDILQDLKYVSSEEKRKTSQNQNAPKDSEIIIHRREDGQTIQFKVIDNIQKLQPQDWDRVVAVFAMGKQWQFKDWPIGYGNPIEIFSKIKGFHLKMSGIPTDPNISKWSVSVTELDPHKRHLDRARLIALWDELDKFVAKTKPYLYS